MRRGTGLNYLTAKRNAAISRRQTDTTQGEKEAKSLDQRTKLKLGLL